MQVNLIYGKAGTGKTQELIKLVRELHSQNKSYVVLAPTHNAVSNIFQRLGSDQSFRGKLMTVHAYFRINYKDNNTMLGPRKLVDNIIFDEFSLIHRQVLTNLITQIFKPINLYFFGDPLQLNAVYESEFENIIFFKDLLRYDKITSERLTCRQIKHMHQSNFYNSPILKHIDSSRVHVKELTKNYRANDSIIQLLNALMAGDRNFNYKFVSKMNIINLLKNPDTFFLGSNYEILQEIYNLYSQEFPKHVTIKQNEGFKTLHLYAGCKIRCLESSEHYYNGQILLILDITPSFLLCQDIITSSEVIVEKVNNSYPVGPYNFLTVHKSQGYTLPNVIICIDNMFELSMLYTAVTRASTSVVFYSKSEQNVDNLIESMHGVELEQLSKFSLM